MYINKNNNPAAIKEKGRIFFYLIDIQIDFIRIIVIL